MATLNRTLRHAGIEPEDVNETSKSTVIQLSLTWVLVFGLGGFGLLLMRAPGSPLTRSN